MIKITKKQHYIPRLYLKEFKNEKDTNGIIKVFLHNKENQKDILEKNIDEIFYKNLFYTTFPDYLEIAKNLKSILENYLENFDEKILETKSDTKEKRDNLAEKISQKVEPNSKEVTLLKKGAIFYKENPLYLKIIEPFKKLMNISINKIEEFLEKNKYEINSLDEIEKISKALYELVKELKIDTNKHRNFLENVRKKVDKATNEDNTYKNDSLQKEGAQEFNKIIYEEIKKLLSTISNILNEIDKAKNNIVLEDKLGSFETTCIIAKKDLNILNSEFKEDIKFKITKYILIQYYRFNNNAWSQKLSEILERKNYKDLKKLIDDEIYLFKLKGIIIKLDEDIFITSDNPILYNEINNIIIFPFSPNIVYLVIKDYHESLKSNFLSLIYKEEKDLIENINFFIKKNANKYIISNKKEILAKKCSEDIFIRNFKKVLQKYKLIKDSI